MNTTNRNRNNFGNNLEGNFGLKSNDELNDANESLKLLKLKMGSKDNINTENNNENYRKPFNPNNMGELDKNLININTNKNAFDINALNNKRESRVNLANVVTSRNNSNAHAGRIRKGPTEEVKDERPAFNEKGDDIYE
jgi:hypothetical protein